jgi:hypothetical protein
MLGSFLKIIPAIAQAIVNDTDLPVYGGTIRALSNDEVAIGLSTALNIPSGLTVKLDPLEMWLYNQDTPDYSPYLMIPLQSYTISGKTDLTIEETVIGIRNRTELRMWLAKVLEQEKTDLSLKGSTKAHLGALKFDISLNKKIEVNALQNLEGFKLDNARIKLPPDEDGSNLFGNLTLPNRSDLTLALGNLTFNAWAGEILVGSTTILNVEAKPGNNTMAFRGEIFMNALFQNFVDILGSQAQAFSSGMLEVGISGNKTIVNGEHITYLEDVLNAVKIKSQIPIMQILSDVLRSVLNGDVELKGLVDIIKDALGPLLDDLLKGLLGEDGGDYVLKDLLGGGSESGRRNVIRKALKAYKGRSNMSLGKLRAHTRVVRSLARIRSRRGPRA